MPQRLTVTYVVGSRFTLPKGVKLLSVEENEAVHAAQREHVPWSWWVKRNALMYYDDKGELHGISGEVDDIDDYKHHTEGSEYLTDDEDGED
jgi:hypothetical protein